MKFICSEYKKDDLWLSICPKWDYDENNYKKDMQNHYLNLQFIDNTFVEVDRFNLPLSKNDFIAKVKSNIDDYDISISCNECQIAAVCVIFEGDADYLEPIEIFNK